MTDPNQLDRHDCTTSQQMGFGIALEVAVTALLRAHPDRAALAAAWKDAEDQGFTWTSDPDPRVGERREQWAKQAYVETMNRLRQAALLP